MLRLKPLPEEKASEQVTDIYHNIKITLAVPNVPLFFQYLGNYPDYLGYVWGVIAPNIQTEGFENSCNQVLIMAKSAIDVIYTPSEQAKTFSSQLHPAEKEQVVHTLQELRLLNVKMMIITIGIRESLKGLFIVSKQLSETTYGAASSEAEGTIHEMVRESLQLQSSREASPVDFKAAHMLVPIYGSSSLMVSQYPDFFRTSAEELETLMKTEAYLKARVELEKITHMLLVQLPSPIHLSYIETEKMLFDKPYAEDVLFVMKDTFPALFPKLVLATEMMEKLV